MKLFRYLSTAALSLVMVGVLAAQTPPQTPAPQGASQTPAAPRAAQPADQAADMTIVGCLAPDTNAADAYFVTITPATAQPQPDAAAAAAAPPANPISDAARATASPRSDASRAAGAPDAARTANMSSAATKPATYKIVGIAADQLKPHVNHQVELKGRIDAANAGNAVTAPAAQAQEFRATSVKMINATCPPTK